METSSFLSRFGSLHEVMRICKLCLKTLHGCIESLPGSLLGSIPSLHTIAPGSTLAAVLRIRITRVGDLLHCNEDPDSEPAIHAHRIRIQLFTLMRIRIQLFTLMLIRIQLFTLMRIRILRLIKVGICNLWFIDPPGLHFEPPGLHCERPRPSIALF